MLLTYLPPPSFIHFPDKLSKEKSLWLKQHCKKKQSCKKYRKTFLSHSFTSENKRRSYFKYCHQYIYKTEFRTNQCAWLFSLPFSFRFFLSTVQRDPVNVFVLFMLLLIVGVFTRRSAFFKNIFYFWTPACHLLVLITISH